MQVARRHWCLLILFPLLILLMTYPTVIKLFDNDSFWLVQDEVDSNMIIWDAWYFKRWISGRADFYYTDLLFHPEGVSLAFHNFSLPHMTLMAALSLALPLDSAFNLAYLLLTFVSGTAAYLYLNYLFRDRLVAFFGTVVFAASAFIIVRPAHTHNAFLATIPLSLYFLHRGLREGSLRCLVAAGLSIGVTAFIGMYTLVCLLIMLGFYLLYFGRESWRQRAFWLNLCALLVIVAAFLALRVYPMLADPQGLSDALNKNIGGSAGQDLLTYFISGRHPLFTAMLEHILPLAPQHRNVVYLGYVPLFLAVLAFVKGVDRRRPLAWTLLLLPFAVLRLGDFLVVNGVEYLHILLPKHYLVKALPHLFKPFWHTPDFHAGTLFPFAALACCGLATVLAGVPARRKPIVVVCLSVLVAFEYYQPQRPEVMREGRLDFIDWLRQEENQDAIHLINLPTGGQSSKYYGFYQTFNGYPHAEGRPTRTPSSAFDYMSANLLLRNWLWHKRTICLPENRVAYIAAQSQLVSDGFTHIVLHHDRWRARRDAHYLANVPAAYRDEHVTIFRVIDLHASCSLAARFAEVALPQFEAAKTKAVLPASRFSILSVDAYESYIDDSWRRGSAVLYDGQEFHLFQEQDIAGAGAGAQSSGNAALASHEVLLLLADRKPANSELTAKYRAWIATRFASCGPLGVEGGGDELFLRRGYPCELTVSAAPLQVQYDNGIELGNLLTERDGDRLKLHLLWTRLPAEAHAFSAQVFDSSGEKALQGDIVFHHEALSQLELDLSALPPGDYAVMLIVYNFETQATAPGTVVGSQHRFERQLEIARLDI